VAIEVVWEQEGEKKEGELSQIRKD
jgi:hypothetical protein